MDFNASLEILKNRSKDNDANDGAQKKCCSRDHVNQIISLPKESSTQSKDLLITLTNLELLNLLITLQSERIQTYMGFNSALEELINTKTIHEYPHLCTELTSRFSVISQNIIIIKDIFIERKLDDIANTINRIQEEEKEKLMLIAAQHLDKIQDNFPEIKMHSESNVTVFSSPSYNNDRIQSIEIKISEYMENLQAFKLDFVDS